MSLNLSTRMGELRASEIREILKVAVDPEVISLAGGLPAAEAFPVRQIEEAVVEVLRSEGCAALQYSTTEGDSELRSRISARMSKNLGASFASDQILITCGSQQGLDLVGKVFLDPGDAVLCESPTYLGAINAFRAYGPRFVEVSTDDHGMVPSALERCLAEHDNVKFIYVVPDFQNPSGRCWSLQRRLNLLEAARRHGVAVVEDAPYAELRFAGRRLPPLAALDEYESVVFLGTFSKIFCPGLRLGWVAGAQQLIHKLVLVKQGVDLHTSTLSQRVAATYLARNDMDAAIERIRDLYRDRRQVMIEALEREMPAGVRFTRPEGGLFVWLELPDGMDARELLERCLELKVAFVPGGSFFPNGGHENTLRLNFSAMVPERIDEGVRRLGRVLRQMVQENPVTDVA